MGRKRYTVEQIIANLREAEVELAKGAKTPEVCRKLGISENTVRYHIKHIYRRLGIKNRAQLVKRLYCYQ